MSYTSTQKIISVEVYPKGWENWSSNWTNIRLFPDITTASNNTYASHGDRTKVINNLDLSVSGGQYRFKDGIYKIDIEFSMKYSTAQSSRLQSLKEDGYVRLYSGGGTLTSLGQPSFRIEDTENEIDPTHNVMSFVGTQYVELSGSTSTGASVYLNGYLYLGSSTFYTFKNTATLIEGKDV